jgi:hypothetical protein
LKKKLYDQNLRDAMKEIRAVLKRRNIGGYVMLNSETHSEYAMMLDIPSWSCITLEDDGQGVAVRIKATPSKHPEDKKRLDATINMLCHLDDLMHNGQQHMEQLITLLRQKFTIIHETGKNMPPDSVPPLSEM